MSLAFQPHCPCVFVFADLKCNQAVVWEVWRGRLLERGVNRKRQICKLYYRDRAPGMFYTMSAVPLALCLQRFSFRRRSRLAGALEAQNRCVRNHRKDRTKLYDTPRAKSNCITSSRLAAGGERGDFGRFARRELAREFWPDHEKSGSARFFISRAAAWASHVGWSMRTVRNG